MSSTHSITIPLIQFTAASSLASTLKSTPDTLTILAYGVPYLPPVVSSLRICHEICVAHDVPVYFMNEENEREFCLRHQIVVGTPFLMFYYDAAPMQIAFVDSGIAKIDAPLRHVRSFSEDSMDGLQVSAQHLSNIFIGQLNRDVMEYILRRAILATKQKDIAPIQLDLQKLEYYRGVHSWHKQYQAQKEELSDISGSNRKKSVSSAKSGATGTDAQETLSPRPQLLRQATVAVLHSPMSSAPSPTSRKRLSATIGEQMLAVAQEDDMYNDPNGDDDESDTDEGETEDETSSSFLSSNGKGESDDDASLDDEGS